MIPLDTSPLILSLLGVQVARLAAGRRARVLGLLGLLAAATTLAVVRVDLAGPVVVGVGLAFAWSVMIAHGVESDRRRIARPLLGLAILTAGLFFQGWLLGIT
ncbi:MAG TPA: hypothetical protein VGC81_11965, partial [Candidatus Methylomirabilis sp.]